MMQRVLRFLAGLIGVLFLALGLMLLFAPGRQTGQFAVLATGNAGLSTLRGDLGGLFLGMALFTLVGAIRASPRWLAVPAIFLTFIVLGRIMNLIFDGRSIESVQAVLLEFVFIAILLLGIASMRSGQPTGSALRFGIAITALLLLLLGAAFAFQRKIGLIFTKQLVERSLHHQLIAALPEGLHVGLCGSGSPLADPTRAGPCVFVIAGKRVYVVDAGDGSTRKMILMGLAPGLIDAIFLTHFHSDHIGGLGEMLLQRWAGGNHQDQVPVIGPQGVEAVVQGFNDAYALDKKYRVAHHGEAIMPPSGSGGAAREFTVVEGSDASQVVLDQDGLRVTAFAVNHEPVFPAVGYRFDYRGRSVVISGDTAPSPTLAKYARGADVLFHEGLQTAMVSLLREATESNGRPAAAKVLSDIPSYHTTPEDAARIAQYAGVRYLMLYHTIPPLPFGYQNAAFLGDAPKIFKGPITVGKDGMMLSLLPGVTSVAIRELL
jgi:ribonuclease Z